MENLISKAPYQDKSSQKIICSSTDILRWYEKKYSVNGKPSSVYRVLNKDEEELIKLLKLIQDQKSNKRILDLGCGDGRYLMLFAKAGFKKITGIDFSKIAINRAKKLAVTLGFEKNIKFIMTDLKDYKLDKEKYDIITCSEVLQQMKRDDVEKILGKIKQAIKVGGYVYIRLCSDIERKLHDGKVFIFDGEANYSAIEAKNLLRKKFEGWNIKYCSSLRIERCWLIPKTIKCLSSYKEYIRRETCIKFLALKEVRL